LCTIVQSVIPVSSCPGRFWVFQFFGGIVGHQQNVVLVLLVLVVLVVLLVVFLVLLVVLVLVWFVARDSRRSSWFFTTGLQAFNGSSSFTVSSFSLW